ncbi:MAG: adenosylcobinamide amidohydrolase [Desulfosarcinaceae bacterium]|nr:adenosylcobinamide amidohydrolase [Desulfosarcinaceae bacterium]
MRLHRSVHLWLLFLLWAVPVAAAQSYPMRFTDDSGRPISLPAPPGRIVSHSPMATEILQALGGERPIVAGDGVLLFYDPRTPPSRSLERNPFHRRIALLPGTPAHALKWIARVGAITGRSDQAHRLEEEIRGDLAVAATKTARLAPDQRLAMLGVSLMDGVLTPLAGSWQAELIARAGGRAIAEARWPANPHERSAALLRFDPQLIFAPREARREIRAALKAPPWDRLSAVRSGRVYFFPARLLNHGLPEAGYMVNALAARAHPELYTNPSHQVRPTRIIRTRRVPIDLEMVTAARVCHHYRYDFLTKTLVVDLQSPQKTLSTLEGFRTGIRTVGNHYAAPPCWWLDAHRGLDSLHRQVLPAIERSAASTSLLFTGADLAHLAVETARYRDMRVVALATAGVRSNAMRLSRDRGNYYEPGTINILLLTSMRLSERAMSRALVTATEAKTAALWDLDVRSSYSPRRHAATGTGTDNLIVVQNSAAATRIDNSGGHTKMGELIATAVYRAVRRSIAGQNGITANRAVGARLAERGIDIAALAAACTLPEGISRRDLQAAIRRELRRPAVADLLTAAMSLEDAAGRGLTRVSSGFEGWCRRVAEEIAGRTLPGGSGALCGSLGATAAALNLALDAMVTGILAQLQTPGSM